MLQVGMAAGHKHRASSIAASDRPGCFASMSISSHLSNIAEAENAPCFTPRHLSLGPLGAILICPALPSPIGFVAPLPNVPW
jgi:hypothetical protein